MLAEHLGMAAADVPREIEARGSLRALIDARARADRTLVEVRVSSHVDPPPDVLRAAADPEEPLNLEEIIETIAPALQPTAGPSREPNWIVTGFAAAAVVVGLFAALLWRAMSHPSMASWLAVAAVAIAALAVAVGLRIWWMVRRVAQVRASQRRRAEFG